MPTTHPLTEDPENVGVNLNTPKPYALIEVMIIPFGLVAYGPTSLAANDPGAG